MKFFQMKFIKVQLPTFYSYCASQRLKEWFERVIGERSKIAVISGSRVVRDPLKEVRDLLGGARPIQDPSAVQNYYGRDLLGGARPVGRPA